MITANQIGLSGHSKGKTTLSPSSDQTINRANDCFLPRSLDSYALLRVSQTSLRGRIHMRPYNNASNATSGPFSLILALIALVALVVFQQSYARSHESGIEQPVELFGVAEMLFRHPERLFVH